jgi:hypothetical protein
MDTLPRTDVVARAGRVGALLAAPLAVLSIGFVIVAEATGEAGAMDTPAAIAGGATGLLATVALLLGLVWLHARTVTRLAGRGGMAMVIALVGAALTVGAAWSLAFVAPAFDARFPGLLEQPLPAVVAGYLASHAVLGLGVIGWAVAARRAGAVSRGVGAALIIGGVLCLLPLPARYLVVAAALLVLALRTPAATVPVEPSEQPTPAMA